MTRAAGADPTALARPISPAALEAFQDRLGHRFATLELLLEAATHRSWCAEHAGHRSNERLEFLGDAVLGLVVTDDLFRRLGDAGEGLMSRVRASVVCAPALAEMAAEIDLGDILLLGKGERASGGRDRPSILADAMEAVIGAIYLDAGYPAAAAVVERLVAPRLAIAGDPDHKSRLHELAAQVPGRRVLFDIVEEGPEHDKIFRATVVFDGQPLGQGTGRSKKQAEQAAAEAAWQSLEDRDAAGAAGERADHG